MPRRTKISTPIGDLYLISYSTVLLAAGFTNFNNLLKRMDPIDTKLDFKDVKAIPKISDLVNDYFDGDLSALNSIEVRQPGTAFYQSIWKQMRKIPAGSTWTYAELAKRAGNAEAVRAAGTACGANLIAPIVPCHRIIKTGGALGNYGYGIKSKEWLLRHEGALN